MNRLQREQLRTEISRHQYPTIAGGWNSQAQSTPKPRWVAEQKRWEVGSNFWETAAEETTCRIEIKKQLSAPNHSPRRGRVWQYSSSSSFLPNGGLTFMTRSPVIIYLDLITKNPGSFGPFFISREHWSKYKLRASWRRSSALKKSRSSVRANQRELL